MSVVNQPYPAAPQSASGEIRVQSGDALPPRTTIPWRSASASRPPQARRQIVGVRREDVLAIGGALAAALATTGVLWTQLAPFTGIVGYIVVTWCLFVLIYVVLVAFDNNQPTVRDRVSAVIMHSLAAVVVLTLAFVVVYTVFKAWPALVHLNFYTQDLHTTQATDPMTKGGVLHAVIGTLIEVGIAMAIAVPLGLLAAVFLNEVPGPLNRMVRTVVDAMTAFPDVLAGLFIYATLILIFGLGECGLAAGCALAVTVVSIICRAAYVVLRLVPGGLTEASYALGSGHWRTVWNVTLPTARSGLATAVILGAARAIGETAPVLLTAGYTNYINVNPANGPMNSLPLASFVLVFTGQGLNVTRGFGAAAVLLALVVLLFAIARMIGGRGPGQLSRGQARRRMAASQSDMARYGRRAAWGQDGTSVSGAIPADYGGARA